MSGGFFRGTSADQDTRFSNKQAKLLKSQKFAAELEHLVDMTKVKMDVIRPWIANRVTELLGFEDEVLINFIYGLLDGKEVNGKEVQISLTGFMEKNTGKFMKELWTLLLSAQKTVSGVPQQFLDAKEEETRKKKAEVDRMANELEKKKEKESRELEQERFKKMDGAVEPKATNSALEPASKHMLPKSSIAHPEENKEADETNGMRGSNRVSRSPHSVDRSSSSPSMRHKSRSVSRSPGLGGRSISSDRMYRSPRRRSVTPHSRHSPRASICPSRRRSSYSRLRSRSRSPRRSPSVRRRLRSPYQRRSLTPVRRHRSSSFRRRRSPSPVRQYRSPSPVRRYRSPSPGRRYISPSPVRRGRSPSFVRRGRSPSPVRRGRSPSPVRRGRSPSPVRRRSPLPVRRRSPLAMRRRSPSPVQRRSPSPLQRISRSPMQRRYQRSSSMQSKSPMPGRRRSRTPKGRSPSPYYSSSPSPIRHRSLSPLRRESPKDHGGSPVLSSEERRSHEKLSPVAHRPSTSLKSPHGDSKDRKDFRNQKYASSPSRDRSRSPLDSPPHARKGSACDQHKRSSPHRSPVRKTRERMIGDGSWSPRKSREQKPYHDSPKTSEEEKETCRAREDKDHESKSSGRRSMQSSTASKQKDLSGRLYYKEEHSPERLARNRRDHMESKKDLERKREKSSGRGTQNETPDQQISPSLYKDSGEGKNSEDRNRSHKGNVKDTDWRRKPVKASKVDDNNGGNNFDSGSEESDKHRAKNKEKRKHKRSERKEVASDEDCSYDSELEDRKEAKRRKREEKKLRKEERRRRREERRHRREERRAEKRKMKNQNASDTSDGEHLPRSESHRSDNEGTESEQKKLEIELRNKALESLKAKKGISH